MQPLNIDEIIPLNAFEKTHPIVIDVVYAQENHPDNHFRNLYAPEAKIMWAHKDIAAVTLRAAQICHQLYGWQLKINDCLRPVEAQEGMETYGFDPVMVSKPGSGAHPRAMAIDIEPLDATGKPILMGTKFDAFPDNPELDNPAARNYTKFPVSLEKNAIIFSNRANLEFAMRYAATSFDREIFPLPQEWWDYREPEKVSNQYLALREDNLHSFQRLIDVDVEGIRQILEGDYPPQIANTLGSVQKLVSTSLSNKDLESRFNF